MTTINNIFQYAVLLLFYSVMNIKSTVILNNGLEMPVIGLGLFMVVQGNETQNAVNTIDTPDMNRLNSLNENFRTSADPEQFT